MNAITTHAAPLDRLQVAAGPSTDPHAERTAFEHLWSLLRRRGGWLVLAGLVGAGAGMAAGLATTPRYTAKALILLEPDTPVVVDLAAVSSGLDRDVSTIETQLRVLTSRQHIDAVIERLDLAEDAELNPPPQPPGLTDALKGAARRLVALARDAMRTPDETVAALPPEAPAAPSSTGEERAAGAFAQRLTVTQEGRSLLLGVAFTSTDPVKAATVANTAAALYLEDRVAQKRAAVQSAASWLDQRLVELRTEVAEAEAAVERHRAAFGLAAQAGVDVTDQRLGDLGREANMAQADLAAREARLARVDELRQQGNLADSLPEVVASPLIVQLRAQETELARGEAELSATFGERHPRMRLARAERERVSQKIAAEVQRIVIGLEDEVAIAKARLQSIQQSLADARADSGDEQQADVGMRELERRAAASRDLYESLLKRQREMREQASLITADARLLSAAEVPRSASSPGAPLFAAAGLVVAVLLGSFGIAIVDRLDHGLRSDGEVRRALGLPAVGLVPRLPRRPGSGWPHDQLIARPRSRYGESIRRVLSVLALAAERRPAKVVLVTSALAGEGKTSMALSLGVLSARSGLRTLLVDLDLRRPSVSSRLRRREEPGVVEAIEDGVPATGLVHRHQPSGLMVLGAGRDAEDPLGIIQGSRLPDLLRELAPDYDRIILDTPPLLAVGDGQLAARLADVVLLALRWGSTPENAARTALELLHEVGASVLGVVLTQVHVRKHARYGYADAGTYYSYHRKYYVS